MSTISMSDTANPERLYANTKLYYIDTGSTGSSIYWIHWILTQTQEALVPVNR